MDVKDALLDAVRCCIRGRKADWPADALPQSGWTALTSLAQEQQVLPMVLQSCYAAPAFLAQSQDFRQSLLGRNRQQAAVGAMRAAAWGALWQELEAAGFRAVIMKGAACRAVYPAPGVRRSSDEDVLVPDGQFRSCLAFFRERGFTCGEVAEDAFEVALRRADGLYIELHRTPFAPDDAVLGGCNAWFEGLYDRSFTVAPEGMPLRVMGAQDHMLLLILHAFKHLLYSGFGLRQVCDMVLWAETYGAQIDWTAITERCRAVRAAGFAAAVFAVGAQYLELDVEKACMPPELLGDEETAALLLGDLLSGGVFGTASRSRHHSAALTHSAVSADRTGEKSSVLQSLFPRREALQGRYPYLKKSPWLLPLAWVSRMGSYGAELLRREDSDAAETLRIARERTELLRKLDIMD